MKLVVFGLFLSCISFMTPCGAQTCTNDDCGQLMIADLYHEFSQWRNLSGSDCNDDGDTNILDFICMIEQVPNLDSPVFTTVEQQSIDVGSRLEFTVFATDPNGDSLIYSAENLPANAEFDVQTQLFHFSPDSTQIGDYIVRFLADDGFLTAVLDVQITVNGIVDCSTDVQTTIITSPAHGEREVAVTRETIVRFTRPLSETTILDATTIAASFGGQVLPANYRLSQDRQTLTLFYSDPLPASARVRLLVDGAIRDERGCFVDVDGDGKPGGSLIVDFDTLTLSTVQNTAVCGRVFASELVRATAANRLVNVPLEGVFITVDGMEETLFAVTDSNGNFRLEPAPAGRFFVHIDGRTVGNNLPAGAYYPFVGKTWTSIAGQEVNIGEVFLPLVIDGTLQEISQTEDTQIYMPQEVIDINPAFAEVSITVPAGALFSDDGSAGGRVGMAPVDPARLPGALPEDLNFPLVITVQTDGPTNFDVPAPVCFPNLPDPDTGLTLAPGEKSALWSFNHDTGRWEISGSMTVSEDGTLVCSDPGTGVRAPGWHGVRPGAQGGGAVPGGTESPGLEPGTGAPETEDPELCDPIYYFSGEFFINYEDLRIAGRGFDFVWERKYRSRVGPNTAQGNGWDFSYNMFIEKSGNLRVVCDGNSRRDEFFPRPDLPNTWGRNEFFRELALNDDDSYTLLFEDRKTWDFFPLDDSPAAGKLSAITDRNGNRMAFNYDTQGRLETITDTLDRDIVIAYNDQGRIASVTDFSGRQIVYDYYQDGDADGGTGDLKSATSPAVRDTPNGNDYPEGKTTVYTYSTGFPTEALNHNLLTITDPKGQVFVRNTYATTTDPNHPDFDRVMRQAWGDPDDIIDLVYVPQDPSAQNGQALIKTIVNDRVGNVREFFYNLSNQLVRLREFTGRADADQATTETANRPIGKLRTDDPDFFETRYEWNLDSLLTRRTDPNGTVVEYIYESDLDPTVSPRKRGNLRIIRRLPGTHAPGGDQLVIEEQFEYDDSFGCGFCGFQFVTRHIDGRGHDTLYEYDENGNRKKITHRIAGIVEDWEYNEFGQMTAHILPDNGNGHRRRDEYSYFDIGPQRGYLESEIVDAPGLALTTTYSYDIVGNAISVTDPRGHDTQYLFNTLDQVVRRISREITDNSEVRYQVDFAYDGNDNLERRDIQNIDEFGNLDDNTHLTTTIEYEILNNPIRQTKEVDANHNIVMEYDYDANRNLTRIRSGEAVNGNQPANTETFVYDERDLVYRRIRGEGTPLQSTAQYNYDGNRNLILEQQGIEASPRIHHTFFDGYNRSILEIDSMGNEIQYQYDANSNVVLARISGELLDIVGDTGNQTLSEEIYIYDAMDRQTGVEISFFDTTSGMPIGDGLAVTTWLYTDNSQIAAVVDDNNNQTSYSYDSANRLEQKLDAAGNVESFTYDANDNMVTLVETDRSDMGAPDQVFITTLTYDNLDRLTTSADNIGNTTTSRYDSRDNRVRVIDPLGNVTTFGYDGIDRNITKEIILTEDGTGSSEQIGSILIQQHWDDSSRLVGRTDGNGNRTSYVYDSLDRINVIVYADDNRKETVYDVHDNAVSTTDGNGSLTANSYDLNDRLIQRGITPGPSVSSDTTFEVFAYDGLSRMVTARDDDAEVSRVYDSMSNIVSETLNGQVTTASFDGVGNMLSCTYPSGRAINHTFDTLDRLSTVNEAAVNLATYNYIGPDRVEQLDLGNGTRMYMTYDGITGIPNPAGDFGVKRVVRSTHTHVASGTVLDDRIYTWDGRYNKTNRTDQARGIQQDFTYDSAYRMIRYSETDGASAITDYTIDAANNRVTVSGAGRPGNYLRDDTLPEPADDQMNQYTQTPFDQRTYDQNGNLVAINPGQPDAQTFTYDYRNRQTQYTNVSDGTVANYAYDPLGRRIDRIVSRGLINEQVRYFYSGERVIEEQDNQGQTTATYVYGNYIDEVLTMQRIGMYFYFHLDDLFSITCLSDADGDLLEFYRYGAYGKAQIFDSTNNTIDDSMVENPYQFTGRRYDKESALYFYRTRYLDNSIGRFISPDSIGNWGDPENFGNNFTVLNSNIWSGLDPYGLFKFGKRPLGDNEHSEGQYNHYEFLDRQNLELYHEHGFFEDKKGGNIGFGPDGRFSENPEKRGYTYDDSYYDDQIIREALKNIDDGEYSLLKNNCQDWAERLRNEYHRIKKTRKR